MEEFNRILTSKNQSLEDFINHLFQNKLES